MGEIVKLKLRLGNQEFDYEGPSEAFPQVYQDFLAKVNTPQPARETKSEGSSVILEEAEAEQVDVATTTKRNGKMSKSKRSYPNPPMDTSLNLHGDSNSPSLRSFFGEKRSSGKLEANAVFAFYLAHYCGLSVFHESHIRACYFNVGERMPAYIRQSLIDAKNKGGYVESTDDGWKLTTVGENLVRLDLPKIKGNEK